MKLIFALLFVAASVLSFAQSEVMLRQDYGVNGPSTTVSIYETKTGLEFWGFNFDTKAPDLEIGKLWRVNSTKQKGTLLLGGYYASFPTTSQRFLLPFAVWNTGGTGVQFSGAMGYYNPISAGNEFKALFSDGIRVTAPLAKGYRGGIEASFFALKGEAPAFWVGPTVTHGSWTTRVQVNPETRAVRYRWELRF